MSEFANTANNFIDRNYDFESDSEDENDDEEMYGHIADRFVPDPGKVSLQL